MCIFKKPKIAILQQNLVHYRVPFFNKLVDNGYSVTVFCERNLINSIEVKFSVEIFKSKTLAGFKLQSDLPSRLKAYDVVVVMYDLRWLTFMRIGLGPMPFRRVLWGIGLSSAKGLGSKPVVDWFRIQLSRLSDATVVYSNIAAEKYRRYRSIDAPIYVAPNSIDSIGYRYDPKEVKIEKNNIIFIGALSARKRVHELLIAYHEAFLYEKNRPRLSIIGDGPEKSNIQKLINDYKLDEYITMYGEITDEDALCSHFLRSFVMVTPSQAGLSVLKSLSYGVPVITRKNAITGGEIEAIKESITGHFYESRHELVNILRLLWNDKAKQELLVINSWDYFWSEHSLEKMVNGMNKAIME